MMRKYAVVSCFILLGLSFFITQAQASYPSFADLAEKLIPSVVNISTTHDSEENADFDNQLETNVNSIFNAPISNKISLGSGFIIDSSGYIITNAHVIDKAQSIMVTLSDNQSVEAKLIGKDTKTDIALIKIGIQKNLPPVKMGDSDAMRVGDWILAIGNPFGLGGSVTAGIISAKSRDIETGPYDNFIQTDASINQGSSGGPMFNLQGELIGVNTAIFSTNGGNMGIGFAIPSNLIKYVIQELKSHGKVDRGWIGIKMQALSAEMAQSLSLKNQQGVIITEVLPNSTAGKAGLVAGDIILSFDKKPIESTRNLSRLVAETPIGKKIELEIWRDKKIQNIKLIIEKMPEDSSSEKQIETFQNDNALIPNGPHIEALGFSLEELTPDIAQKYHLSSSTIGLIITHVNPNSDAAQKGLKAGNLILAMDKKPVLDLNDIHNGIREAQHNQNRPVLLQVKDGEQIYLVALKLQNDKDEQNVSD